MTSISTAGHQPPVLEDVGPLRGQFDGTGGIQVLRTPAGIFTSAGHGNHDIRLVIHADGSSTMYLNGRAEQEFTAEDTKHLIILTADGNSKVTIEDRRSFQDLPLPPVMKATYSQGQTRVIYEYPGYPPQEIPPLQPGESTVFPK